MHLTSVSCPNDFCDDLIGFAATSCKGCGRQDVGYPNVRYANDPAEVAALDQRVTEAFAAAARNGSDATLRAFEDAVSESSAITVMQPADLFGLLSHNRLWVSFYKQTRAAESRVAERNKWDMNRDANDGKINPQFYDELNYAVLSLTDHGSGWYGGCHVTLSSERIAIRASVFWENPFQFLRKVEVGPDELVPPGYRASWERRARLAVAKLHDRVEPRTPRAAFPGILLERDPSRGDTDFIEVHIYGAVSPTAFVKVTTDTSLLDDDELLVWESVRSRLAKLGVPVREANDA